MENGKRINRLFNTPETADRYLQTVYDSFKDEEELREFSASVVEYQAALINLMVEETRMKTWEIPAGLARATFECRTLDAAKGSENLQSLTRTAVIREEYNRAFCEYQVARGKLKEALRIR